jgi:pimeloyl-ACP methyl ester carboxylesterase
VTIRDAAHLPCMERPEAFNRIVQDFLAVVETDASGRSV